MSSIDISAVDVDTSSGSSWDGSDSELEVEVTHVVQQQKEEEEEEELDLELDESHTAAEQRATIRLFEAARLFNFMYVKQHELDAVDIDILQEVFPFVTPTALLQLVVEKDQHRSV